MDSRHPLRRHYALELALGIAVALIAAWALLDPSRDARGELGATRRAAPSGEERPARLASAPEPTEEASPTPPPREPVAPVASTLPSGPEVRLPPRAKPTATPGVLEVLVRDEQGRPQPGISLTLEARGRWSQRVPPRTALTDLEGRAGIPLAWFDPVPEFEDPTRYLRPQVPLREPPTIEFQRPPAPGLVLLTLPVGGRLRVRVLDELGQAVESGAGVYAAISDGSGDLSASAELRDGVAELPWIPLNARLELRATRPDQSATTTRLHLGGPTFPGEVVECEIVLNEWPRLRMRVLDERGMPLGSLRFTLKTTLTPLSPHWTGATSAPDGTLEFELLARHESEHERVLELSVAQPRARVGEVRLPFRLEHGTPTELGDVVVRPGFPAR